jgi:DNA-binding response OmpR family regulator
MRVLIAEDDRLSRRLLEAHVERAGYEVLAVEDGTEAFEVLTAVGGPRLAIADWMMPRMDGIELCRRLRQSGGAYTYLILLTARCQPEDRAAGFEAGADDYLVKPFDARELRARLGVGARILSLQEELERKVAQLEAAANHVERLQDLLPICMHCKKIRTDETTWHRLEAYVERLTGAEVTHALCDECMAAHYPSLTRRISDRRRAGT